MKLSPRTLNRMQEQVGIYQYNNFYWQIGREEK
jgi:hypothetical protein